MSNEEEYTDEDVIEALETAISDVGSWRWWDITNDIVVLEFGDVQLLNKDTLDKNSRSSVVALRFSGNSFLQVYDNDEKEGWHNDLHEDKIKPFDIFGEYFKFCDDDAIEAFRDKYKTKTVIKEGIPHERLTVSFECGGVAVIAGGDDFFIYSGEYLGDKQIMNRNRLWWEFWKDYWEKRETEEAYPYDTACEETIPVKTEPTPGNEEWGKANGW